ncbi:MAG: hypothetical protein V8R48_14180 [Eggerthella lenta]
MPTRTKKQGIRAAARAIAACSLALALALPGAALAADQPGSTALGIRVTDSAQAVKMVLDPATARPRRRWRCPTTRCPPRPPSPRATATRSSAGSTRRRAGPASPSTPP